MTDAGGAAATMEPGGALAVFRNPPFLRLWLSQAATQIGGNMVLFGLTVIVVNSTELEHGGQPADPVASWCPPCCSAPWPASTSIGIDRA